MHRATLDIDMVRMTLTPADEPILLLGRGAIIDVQYTYTPRDPVDAESVDVFTPKTATLLRPLVLRDDDDFALLMLGSEMNILGILSRKQLDWIAENLPIPAGPT